MLPSNEQFRPHVPPEEAPAELTIRAVFLGAVLGVLFGAASVYLALKIGLTTSASVPIAVMSIAVLKKLGRSTILENNMVQTVGSAGESIASAVVFTVPALVLLDAPLDLMRTLLIALLGGLLGVLMMIPLRRYLIVQEHGNLRFPEGTACAEILKAGETGKSSARKIFLGLGAGALYKVCTNVFGIFKGTFKHELGFMKGASVGMESGPELMGVGYIIGFKTSVIMVGGSVLASFVLGPMIAFFGAESSHVIFPAEKKLIGEMSAYDIYHDYVKYIGAGAVAAGGIIGLIRALPSIVGSIGASFGQLAAMFGRRAVAAADVPRTERDTPISIVLIGTIVLVGLIWLIPIFHMPVLGAVLIVIFGFLFSAVSARITGMVGSSSCPLSGMTIAVVMGTCLLFLGVDWKGSDYWVLALSIGAIVCVAISNAGTTAQDLKTGFLVGSTPKNQQIGLLVGVVTSAVVVGFTVIILNASRSADQLLEKPFNVDAATLSGAKEVHTNWKPESATAPVRADTTKTYDFVWLSNVEGVRKAGNYLVDPVSHAAVFYRRDAIGNAFEAPQAALMATLIRGLLDQKLAWGLIGIGVAIAIFIELLGLHALTFAVGVYLPLSSTLPIFVGGVVRWIADRIYKRTPDDIEETEGTLYSSGLIAGGAIVAVIAALLGLGAEFGYDFQVGCFDKVLDPTEDNALPQLIAFGPKVMPNFFASSIPTMIAFGLLGLLLFWQARAPKKTQS
ncbi:MAG: oligopeptide transporter, OPT family [Planctomycetes bacterium]|nr:oligopeptide transporter, OPT family [Planctomycetota bacterium]